MYTLKEIESKYNVIKKDILGELFFLEIRDNNNVIFLEGKVCCRVDYMITKNKIIAKAISKMNEYESIKLINN